MVVDGLAEALEPRHDDRPPAVGEAQQDRADAGVRDDDARLAHERGEVGHRQEVHALGARGLDGRAAVLHDHALARLTRRHGAQQAVERELARAGGDEDHRSPKTVPA